MNEPNSVGVAVRDEGERAGQVSSGFDYEIRVLGKAGEERSRALAVKNESTFLFSSGTSFFQAEYALLKVDGSS